MGDLEAARAFCSMSRTDAPAWLTEVMTSMTWATMSGARPIEGSSSMISLGPAIIARPMASICCSPPERVPPCWRIRSLRRGSRS